MAVGTASDRATAPVPAWSHVLAVLGGVSVLGAAAVAIPLVAVGLLLGAGSAVPRDTVDVLYPLATLGLYASPVLVVLFLLGVSVAVVSMVLSKRTGSALWWIPLAGLVAVAAFVALPLVLGVIVGVLPAVPST